MTRVWVRDHWNGGSIQVAWRHLSAGPGPFAEAAWRHAREILARRGADPVTETEIARTVTALLDRAAAGPPGDSPGSADLPLPAGPAAVKAAARRKDRKIAARARASGPDGGPLPAGMAPPPGGAGAGTAAAEVPVAPGRSGRRTRPDAGRPAGWARPDPGDEPPPATVVPLEIFDARKEAQRRW